MSNSARDEKAFAAERGSCWRYGYNVKASRVTTTGAPFVMNTAIRRDVMILSRSL